MLPDFSTFSENEKIAWLHDNATNVKQGNYFRKYSQDELESKKDSLVDTCIDIDHKLENFGINTEKKYTVKDLIKLLKFNKHMFESANEVDGVIEKLMRLSVKVTSQIEKTQPNQSGSVNNNYSKTVEAEHHKLVMWCEVYSGGEKVKFTVEIWLDSEGKSVLFWLESVTLEELIVSMSEKMVGEVIEKIDKLPEMNIPIINI